MWFCDPKGYYVLRNIGSRNNFEIVAMVMEWLGSVYFVFWPF